MSLVSDEDLQKSNKRIPGIYRLGSVKKIRGVEGKTPWLFDFSDNYSLFDWGKMPDELPLKGKSLALMTMALYDHLSSGKAWKSLDNLPVWMRPNPLVHSLLEWLKGHGLQTHLKGVWGDQGSININDNKVWETQTPLFLDFTPFKVQKPHWNENKSFWDYSAFKNPKLTGMVPLEVIFRFGLPQGSSFRKRMKNQVYLESLFQGVPKESSDIFIKALKENEYDNKLWDYPIIEFSTKWEPEDRFISYKEAQKISGLSDSEWSTFIEWNRLVAIQLRSFFEKFDLVLWDGKCEWGNCLNKGPFLGQRSFILADSLGPDELRLTHKGVPLSKEILRMFYRKSKWASYVSQAKEEARLKGIKDWKEYFYNSCFPIDREPPRLIEEQKKIFSMIYQTLSNYVCREVYKKEPFPNSLNIEGLVKAIKDLDSKGRGAGNEKL